MGKIKITFEKTWDRENYTCLGTFYFLPFKTDGKSYMKCAVRAVTMTPVPLVAPSGQPVNTCKFIDCLKVFSSYFVPAPTTHVANKQNFEINITLRILDLVVIWFLVVTVFKLVSSGMCPLWCEVRDCRRAVPCLQTILGK